jgi:hypothetical protein
MTFLIATATAATAAIVALAVVALPAIGNAGTSGTTTDNSDVSALAACLAAHGLAGAPSTGPELKVWLADKSRSDPDRVGPAMDACQSSVPDSGSPGPEVQAMISCLRSHGIDAPTALGDFKRWFGEQQQAGASKALENALIACKSALAPDTKAPAAAKPDCGAPAGTSGPPADKPKQPTAPGDTDGT